MSSFKTGITNYIKSPFPLNANLFDTFILTEEYSLGAKQKNGELENLITDGQAIFLMVISKLQKLGVQFSSPGNSQKRNFICWFNSHFVDNEPFSYSIEIKKQYFDLAYDMVLNLIKEKLMIKSENNDFEKLKLEGVDNLTLKGKEFLTSVFC